MAAFEQSVFVEPGENEFEGSLLDLLAKTLSDHAQAGMVGSAFIELVTEESAQGKGVGATTGNGPFAGEVFKEAYHEHLEVDRRIDAGTSSPFGIGISGSTDVPNSFGEPDLVEGVIQFAVECAGSGLRKTPSLNPEFLLILLRTISTLKHDEVENSANHTGFSTGC